MLKVRWKGKSREGRSGGGQNIVRERGRIESNKIIFVSADRADGGEDTISIFMKRNYFFDEIARSGAQF